MTHPALIERVKGVVVTRGALLLAAAICLACALLAVRFTGDYVLLGADSYLIAATSRVESAGDLGRILGDELMGGAFPHGSMYRPTFGLSVALDWLVWGDDPFGYNLTTALLYALAGLAVFGLARRLAPRARVAPWAVMAAYLAHPIHGSVLPVLARRPELLVTVLVCATLLVSLRGPRRSRALHYGAVALLAALAMGAKGTAAVLLPLAFSAHLVAGQRAGDIPGALRASIPPLVGVLAALGVRFAVLGGLGGYYDSDPSELAGVLGIVVTDLFVPGETLDGLFVLVSAFAFVGVVAVVVTVAEHLRGAGQQHPAVFAPLPTIGLSWLLLGVVMSQAGGGRAFSWYGALPLVGWSLLIGSVLETLVRAAGSRRDWLGGVAGAAAAAMALIVVWFAFGSPVVDERPSWPKKSARITRYFEETRARVLASGPGETVRAPVMPNREPGRDARSRSPLLKGYALQGWVDLTLPSHPAQVVFNSQIVGRARGHRPPPDERTLVVERPSQR